MTEEQVKVATEMALKKLEEGDDHGYTCHIIYASFGCVSRGGEYIGFIHEDSEVAEKARDIYEEFVNDRHGDIDYFIDLSEGNEKQAEQERAECIKAFGEHLIETGKYKEWRDED